ncbi:putative type II/IV secretion system protein [Serratia symbiotica str. Tucson]|uniref:Putative type II/IV secretion system protein n=1 Tax=Serratia symbiotica str. Tucson TaxID=914128 RepID=E9CNA8_9GAMM|nr:ATPase, T2SS/T4P/T4SS family [Serratia symbiotica]EFW11942.1 putative type II/IV secretion system protein [Serratia symbiotica str. Tucson]
MTPDKDIMEFVFVERHPTRGVILLVDGNRRKDAAIQRWVMDVTRAYPGAKTEFVSLSELNRRREASERQGYGLSQGISEADLKSRDVSVSQDKVISYFKLAQEFNASDIHLEISADRRLTIVQLRIHGELEVVDEVKYEEGLTLASTIYISMCDVREQSFFAGREQSGRIDAKFARRAGLFGTRYEHRPTPDGLIVVMRTIPDDGDNVPTLQKLGFLAEQISLIMRILRLPEGMVLLTGPTGSGKSATLRVFSDIWLNLTGGKKRLLTLENPPEGRIRGAIQTPVMPEDNSPEAISRAWSNANASALRLDPDAILTGEMRDLHSLIAAIYASETGHALFSTLHTQSAIGALRRMEHFGVDRHLIADASLVTGLVGQRLVPLLCEKCRIPWVEKAPELASDIRTRLERYCTVEGGSEPGKLYFRNHEGCDHCRKTILLTGRIISRGVTGRTAIAEVVRTDARLMQLWLSHGPAVARQHWINQGGITRRMHLMRYLTEGRVDPLEGDLICPLDEDDLMKCEVPDGC